MAGYSASQMDARPEVPAEAIGHDAVGQDALERFLSVKGEGDGWDFKQLLALEGAARVELARDAMALGNHRGGGTLIIGVTKSYEYPGLLSGAEVDTTKIANAIQKYIDGDFTVVAAEHLATPPGGEEQARFGIVHFGRRSRQPLIAAQDGVARVNGEDKVFFREADVFVRRGAQSIRANSGDLRLLLEATAVDEARVQGIRQVWSAVVDVRALLSSVEFVYDMLTVEEYPRAFTTPSLAVGMQELRITNVTEKIAQLQRQVLLERPHVGDQLYGLFRVYSAFCGRLIYKTQENWNDGHFLGWGRDADESDDQALLDLLGRMVPPARLEGLWQRDAAYRPLRPLLDEMEQVIVGETRRILSGWA